jgi:hypothetical protein
MTPEEYRDFPVNVSRAIQILLLVLYLAPGCATVSCKPISIVVAKKEERVVSELRPAGTRATPTGGMEEVQRQVRVREYWVQSKEQRWYRISEDKYEVTVPERSIEVCP